MNKKRLYTSELNIVAIVSNALVHKQPKNVTLKQIKSEISHILGISSLEKHYLWLSSNKMYNSVSKRVFSKLNKVGYKKIKEEGYHETLKKRQNIVYAVQKKLYIYSGELEKIKNEVARSVEHREKHDNIRSLLDNSRAGKDYSPFFLCSSHINPAKDHAQHEGKLYFDEDWKNFVPDATVQARILRIIRDRKLRSVQDITGAPVYLITRPNCKHYMIPVTIDEVSHSGTKGLLKAHNMYMPDDEPLSDETRRYRAYYDRLKALEHLQSICPSEELDKDITDTRRLMRIWYNRAKKSK